jgi:hypothetical protein
MMMSAMSAIIPVVVVINEVMAIMLRSSSCILTVSLAICYATLP